MTDDLIAQAEAALDGVTEGPWESSADHEELPFNVMPRVYSNPTGGSLGSTLLAEVGNLTLEQDEWEANARFIAWCRAGVPKLLDALKAAERAAALTELARLDAPLISADGAQGKIPRYDLEQPTSHMGSAAMQRDDYGDWVRYEDHAAAITVVSPGEYAGLIAQLTRRADEMEAIDHSCSLQPAWVLEAITALEKAVKDNRRAAVALTASEAARKRAEDDLRYWLGEYETVLAGRADETERADAAEATVATLTAQVEAMRGALEANLTFADKVAEAADIDTEETALNVRVMPEGREVARRTWAEVIAQGRAALTTENQTNGME